MINNDTLQRFIFEDGSIRGHIVHLNSSYLTIMEQHHYPKPIQKLLGETIVASVLLSAGIKFKGNLTIQFQSDGVVKLLVAKCDDQFHIRGLAQYDHDRLTDAIEPDALLGNGQLVITIQAEETGAKSYQSIVPLENKKISESLESYFGLSEQLATKIWLVAKENSAVGLLLQLLPEQPEHKRELFWQFASILDEKLKNKSIFNLDNLSLLQHLFEETDIRIFEPNLINFKCTCSVERMENAIYMLGKRETNDILRENSQVIVTCEFCNRSYGFDKVDVTEIFRKHKKRE